MTTHLLLVQHGKALDETVDPERHLSEAGKHETERMGAFLQQKYRNAVSIIYHSGKWRARETAEILANALQPPKGVQQGEHLNPLDDPTMWLQILENMTETVMLVGHLPHLSRLTSLLITRRPDDEIIKFRYSGVACLEKKDEKTNIWILKWFITPDLI